MVKAIDIMDKIPIEDEFKGIVTVYKSDIRKANRKILKEQKKDEIGFLLKVKERLKGYGCGYHKQLQKMLFNRIKKLKQIR